jgi:hypothetical protein
MASFLLEKATPSLLEQEAGWVANLIWIFWRRKVFLLPRLKQFSSKQSPPMKTERHIIKEHDPCWTELLYVCIRGRYPQQCNEHKILNDVYNFTNFIITAEINLLKPSDFFTYNQV